ncbi:MAG TPA: [FeFe] hydrogenase, group A [Oscillospiraceae bacterium]|nr:[FeFe] hydrogenase, group A [Oscillospiraceae bacterium]
MVTLKIDNQTVTVPEGTSILEAARGAGISIPTLCYLKGLNEIGACRICLVQVKGKEGFVSSCNTPVKEGMEVVTDSEEVKAARKESFQLILAEHEVACGTCVRAGTCGVQGLARPIGTFATPYEKKITHEEWDPDLVLQRDSTKCVNCMRCVAVCDKMQAVHIWENKDGKVRVRDGKKLAETDCTFCGQCVTHCPVAALKERDDTDKALAAIADPEKITVVQIAPAVRAAWGEALNMDRDAATVNKLVCALRKIGFNYIFDTNFAADLTIVEEGSELVDHIKNGTLNAPMFTSCCPAWIRFVKGQYPEFVDHISTAKSPQQMFGAVTKTYYAKLLGVDPSKIFTVSVMPCMAKKAEAALPTMNDAGAGQDIDLVLTTREVARMIRKAKILPKDLVDEEFDAPLGVSTGAAVIFGATGGVMEAALRSAYFLMTGKNPEPDAFKDVRGMDGWKEATFEINGLKLKTAVASGLGNTRKLLDALKRGEVHYDFVEIMACPGGCAGGGGQPISLNEERADVRGAKLYELDKNNPLRFSHENPAVQALYKDYMEAPLSHKAHKLLHTDPKAWKMPGEK